VIEKRFSLLGRFLLGVGKRSKKGQLHGVVGDGVENCVEPAMTKKMSLYRPVNYSEH
jgi:hypothetical protein